MGLRFLLVDDEADTRYLLRLIIEREGGTVVGEAADGRAGLDLAAQVQPDVVVLDLQMPVMGGLEALPLLQERAPAARVVVLSHLTGDRVRRESAARGAVGYVEKTTPQERLYDELVLAAGLVDVVAQASVVRHLPPKPESARDARRTVTELLERWRCGQLVDDMALLVSEVVTNAIAHAGTPIDLSVELLPDRLRIAVYDGSGATPQRRHVDTDATGGRGMFLVETLAQDWGVEQHEHGKTVWFELPRPADDLVDGRRAGA